MRGRRDQQTSRQRSRHFNPRPLAGATWTCLHKWQAAQISIHAPLRGRHRQLDFRFRPRDFNPRPLAGATQAKEMTWTIQEFQSTPPCGGDRKGKGVTAWNGISIHAPLRGRRSIALARSEVCKISIHAPLRGRPSVDILDSLALIFQSTPPCGGDLLM